MGYIIDDKNFINDNIFLFEQRLGSQYSVFLEKNPTFVNYYHINNINSITDGGLLNIEKLLGEDSPLKYEKVENFPIYGIEQIKLDLSDEEEGLNSSYEGDGIILPNTIKPLPNDFFAISYLNKEYLFMVTQIDYDTIKSNNFYKIGFALQYMTDEYYNALEHQVLTKYNCIFKNIGTEDKCIIESDIYEKIKELETIYTKYVNRYKTLFYSKKFNSFIFRLGDNILYDKYLSHFIDSNRLFNKREEYNTIILNNEDYGDYFTIEYEDSFYDKLENRNIENVEYTRFVTRGITYPQSIFVYYNLLDTIKSVWFIDTSDREYLSDRLIDYIRSNKYPADLSIIDEMVIKHFNNTYETIYSLDVDRLIIYRMEYSFKDFIMIPMILFVLRDFIQKFMHI